jgi:hypothetical protein
MGKDNLLLRVGVKQGGCSGMSYVMDFEQEANVKVKSATWQVLLCIVCAEHCCNSSSTCVNLTQVQAAGKCRMCTSLSMTLRNYAAKMGRQCKGSCYSMPGLSQHFLQHQPSSSSSCTQCRLCAMIHLLQHVWEPNVKVCRRDENEQKQYMYYASSTVWTVVATWAVLDHRWQCAASLCCHPQANATLYLPPFRVTIMSSSMKGSSWRATQKACCTSLA